MFTVFLALTVMYIHCLFRKKSAENFNIFNI